MASKGKKRLATYAHSLQSEDIFGVWVPVVALTASKTEALAKPRRDQMLHRLEVALAHMRDEANPTKWAWRDLTDMVNFLQSLTELGWATDEGGHIDAAKLVLFNAGRSLEGQGCARTDDAGDASLREVLQQFGELLAQLSAHSYWHAVRHTKNRIQALLVGGAKRQGDTVVAI